MVKYVGMAVQKEKGLHINTNSSLIYGFMYLLMHVLLLYAITLCLASYTQVNKKLRKFEV